MKLAHPKDWSKAEVGRLKAMARRRVDTEQIAIALGRHVGISEEEDARIGIGPAEEGAAWGCLLNSCAKRYWIVRWKRSGSMSILQRKSATSTISRCSRALPLPIGGLPKTTRRASRTNTRSWNEPHWPPHHQLAMARRGLPLSAAWRTCADSPSGRPGRE